MHYVFALLAPPFALLSCGEIFQYIGSLLIEAVAILLAFLFFPIGVVVHLVAVVHGVLAVRDHHADMAADRPYVQTNKRLTNLSPAISRQRF